METPEERDVRYTFEFDPVYKRIKDIGNEPGASDIPDDHVQKKTDYNIDPNC